jgi:NAD(P)-dependent dehydrogenase (short-subunit alcohol dehydrogenase family)
MTRPVAFVTGAARGIGRACAEALAEAGFDIYVADLADQPVVALEEAITAHGARFAYGRCDIAHVASHELTVDDCVAKLGGIDCLVNNAGVGAVVRGDMLSVAPENFDRVMNINLRGTVFPDQCGCPRDAEQRVEPPTFDRHHHLGERRDGFA